MIPPGAHVATISLLRCVSSIQVPALERMSCVSCVIRESLDVPSKSESNKGNS